MSNDTDIVEAAHHAYANARYGPLSYIKGEYIPAVEREAMEAAVKVVLASRQTDEPEAGLAEELAEAVHAWDTVDPNDPFAGMIKSLKASRVAVVVEKNLDTILTALSRNHRDAVRDIADRLIDQRDEPVGSETERLHYWRDKAIDAAQALKEPKP